MNNNNSEGSRSNRSNIIPHDSNLRGYSLRNSFYDSPFNMDFEYGYLNLMFNITAFTARTQDLYQTLENNLSGIIELQNERRRLEFESRQTGETIDARETRETRENNENSNIRQPSMQNASQSSTSQESRQNIFTPRSTSSTTNDNLNYLFGTRNVFLGLNPMAIYSNNTTTGSNVNRLFRRNRNGLTIQEIEDNTEIMSYDSINTAGQAINTECPISRDTFTPSSIVLRVKECGHCFVPFRMMTWLESHSTCPLCRRNVIPEVTPVAAASTSDTTDTSASPASPDSPAPPAPPAATTSESSFSNILNNIRNNSNLDNLSIDNINDDSLVFSFDLPRPRNDTQSREFTNTYLSTLSQIFSNMNTNTNNARTSATNTAQNTTASATTTTTTNQNNNTHEENDIEHNSTTSEYDEVD